MKFPLQSTVTIGKYVASQQRKGERYPLVLMLEPRLACNIACIGCGKIREYESNRARLSVEECIDAGVQCPAPVVSICGGEPLVFKGIEEVAAGMLENNKTVELCTNALRLEQCLDWFEPSPRMTFVVHLDGMREIHDYVCDYPGLWDIAVDAIKLARSRGFRVTTNTTIFKETEIDDVIEMMRYLTDEVGIDGMLVAPGYQYSQIDPALTMTRAEHEVKFRQLRTAVRKHGYRWLATPIYQDFLTGERKLSCAPWGSITRNPYGWKGPCYLLTDGIFPTYEALLEGMEWEAYGPGNDPRCEHCGIHSGFEPSTAFESSTSLKTVRRCVDADGLTFACATSAERRQAARPAHRRSRRERPGAVSFGLWDAATDCVGEVLDATRVVDEHGESLWEGSALGIPGARDATVLASDALVHDAVERRRLHEASGADAVDMESGVLARSGRLVGVLRVVSDGVDSAIEGVDTTVHADGSTDVVGLLRWVATRRTDAVRSMRDAVTALRELEKAVA
jgi:hopanoid biosynthesis associated radical SAM protein HpnH